MLRPSLKIVLITATLGWLAAAGFGFVAMTRYDLAAGVSGVAPVDWPVGTSFSRAGQGYTLVTFLHPHCPCSRASLTELAEIVDRAKGNAALTVFILMDRPAAADAGWERTPLWDQAAAIPGARVLSDPAGVEACRFDAATSGQAMLYDAAGRLCFSGGLTRARGAVGDSPGTEAILQQLATSHSASIQAPVFGCELFDRAASRRLPSTP